MAKQAESKPLDAYWNYRCPGCGQRMHTMEDTIRRNPGHTCYACWRKANPTA